MRIALVPRSVNRDCVQLTEADISGAFALSSIVGWNQTREDWRLLLELSDACFGIKVDGGLVATATLVPYGRTLAWLGMVVTHPDFRRRGLARNLVAHVMEHAGKFGIQTVGLDATDEGRPLYESFGFQPEQRVERWQRGPLSGAPCFDPDTKACGYDRKQLLERLSARADAFYESSGYALSRSGRINRYLGPCVAVSQDAARSVIEKTLSRHPDTGWFWDLLPANERAVALARELGFECVRKLTRMSWGTKIHGEEESIFAIAGFELG